MRVYRSYAGTIVASLLLTLSGGCALVDMKLPLSYEPASQAVRGQGPVEIARPPDPDFRKNSEGLPIIGNVRNGYGVHTADVVARDSIPDWFASACAAQFSKVGYQAKVVQQLSPGCQRGIELEIQHVTTDMDPGMLTVGGVSQVEFVITFTKGGERVEQLRFEGTGDDRGMLGGGGELENGLRKAMQVCLTQATQYAAAAWKE